MIERIVAPSYWIDNIRPDQTTVLMHPEQYVVDLARDGVPR